MRRHARPRTLRGEIDRYCSYKGVELTKIFSDIDFSAFRDTTSLLNLAEPHITSARGKSWQQWRRLRMIGPPRTEVNAS